MSWLIILPGRIRCWIIVTMKFLLFANWLEIDIRQIINCNTPFEFWVRLIAKGKLISLFMHNFKCSIIQSQPMPFPIPFPFLKLTSLYFPVLPCVLSCDPLRRCDEWTSFKFEIWKETKFRDKQSERKNSKWNRNGMRLKTGCLTASERDWKHMRVHLLWNLCFSDINYHMISKNARLYAALRFETLSTLHETLNY